MVLVAGGEVGLLAGMRDPRLQGQYLPRVQLQFALPVIETLAHIVGHVLPEAVVELGSGREAPVECARLAADPGIEQALPVVTKSGST
ncbi:MAG TPA: hypothetical protein VMV78_14965 [Thiobacillus sp.]|jgi:hypothetical protein|nr:hypothetical protein [Thiobacillus sp.]